MRKCAVPESNSGAIRCSKLLLVYRIISRVLLSLIQIFFWTASQLRHLLTAGPVLYTSSMSLIVCYRLTRRIEAAEERLWSFLQDRSGFMSIRDDCIDFWVPEHYESFFLLLGGDLERRSDLDYIA